MKAFPPLTHVALTVRNLSVSVPWNGALFGAEPVIDEDTSGDFHYTVYLVGNSTLIGLHQHVDPAPDERFSEFRVGLDHVAFGCEDRAELERWMHRLGMTPFVAGCRKRPSQGGDTGSNPVGTTQVSGHVLGSRGLVAPHWPSGVHGLFTAPLFSGRLPHKPEWSANGLDGVAAELRGLVQEHDAVLRESSRIYFDRSRT
jgi:catechol 2,3-dioxygenase-like lactoylglutathione lyase family enzyme